MTDDSDPQVPDGAAVFPLIPAELGVHPLLLAVLHGVVFFDGSTDEVVDPDAASEALEYLATYLQRLDGRDLQRMRDDMTTLVAYARQEKWSKESVHFLKDFMQSFGIGQESTP